METLDYGRIVVYAGEVLNAVSFRCFVKNIANADPAKAFQVRKMRAGNFREMTFTRVCTK